MSFEEWLRKRWYIALILVFLVSAASQFVSDVYGIPILGSLGRLLSLAIALGVSYILFRIVNWKEAKVQQKHNLDRPD
jgi:hypothetical protein